MSSEPKQAQDAEPVAAGTNSSAGELPFSVYSNVEKRVYVYIASLAAFTSPVATSIYFPAVNILASDLHTSLANINLTITTYMVQYPLSTFFTFIFIIRRRSVKPSRPPSSEACPTDLVGGPPTSGVSPSSSAPT